MKNDSHRFLLSLLSQAVTITILTAIPAFADSGSLAVTVIDQYTHFAVPAVVKASGPETFTQTVDWAGRLRRSVTVGEYTVEVSAPGYSTMNTHITVAGGQTSPTIIVLQPLSPPDEENLVGTRLRPGFTLLHSYAVDDNGQPVAGVKVRLEKSKAETVTDARGYYWLSAPTPPETQRGVPTTDTIIADKPGYKTVIHRNILMPPEDGGGYFLGMERGTGQLEFDDTHKVLRKNIEPQGVKPYPPKKKSPDPHGWADRAAGPSEATRLSFASEASSVPVPATIRVGLNCTNPQQISTCTPCNWGACNTTVSYSLEGYVREGLGQEWLTSWVLDSLKAGAVAYRSYGAYYTVFANGHTNLFDICSEAQCQIFNPNWGPIPSKVTTAQSDTAAIILTDGVDPFFAEYSLEENFANADQWSTCSDGQIGEPRNPDNPWPCMKDYLCTGDTSWGGSYPQHSHSRGMCQRGSNRWATGTNAMGVAVTSPRDWQCILNHYYNANSNNITVAAADGSFPGAPLRNAFILGAPTYGQIAYQDATTSPWSLRLASAADGSGDTLLVQPGGEPSFAPGGGMLAYAGGTGNTGIWVMNANGTGKRQLTSPQGADQYGVPYHDYNPAWSPIGDKIAFCSYRSDTGFGVWTINPDATGLTFVSQLFANLFVNPIADAGYNQGCYLTWASDGSRIAFNGDTAYVPSGSGTKVDTYSVSADGLGTTLNLTNCLVAGGPAYCVNPNWSPDGVKIVFHDMDYQGDNVGGAGIYTIGFQPGVPDPIPYLTRVWSATQNTFYPHWTADGQQILFTYQNAGKFGIWSMDAHDVGLKQVIGASKNYKFAPLQFDCSRCPNFDK